MLYYCMKCEIQVYGQEAKEIKPGDIFIPVFGSVEGHDVVTLVKNQALKDLIKRYDRDEISLGQIINYIRDLTSLEAVTQ